LGSQELSKKLGKTVSSGVSFMPIRLKIILIGKIKGKGHKISVILYYLCNRNIL